MWTSDAWLSLSRDAYGRVVVGIRCLSPMSVTRFQRTGCLTAAAPDRGRGNIGAIRRSYRRPLRVSRDTFGAQPENGHVRGDYSDTLLGVR